MGQDTYSREIEVQTDQFQIQFSLTIEENVDDPKTVADDLEAHLQDSLVEFVVLQGTDDG